MVLELFLFEVCSGYIHYSSAVQSQRQFRPAGVELGSAYYRGLND